MHYNCLSLLCYMEVCKDWLQSFWFEAAKLVRPQGQRNWLGHGDTKAFW